MGLAQAPQDTFPAIAGADSVIATGAPFLKQLERAGCQFRERFDMKGRTAIATGELD
jgi:hypothetical protein